MIDSTLPPYLTLILGASALVADLQKLLASPIVALTFIFAVGALGLYMLLPGEQPFSASAVQWFGGPLMVISLVLLAALVALPATWWPQIPDAEIVSRIAFAIPAAVSLATAVRALTSRRMTICALWFAALLASNSVLFVLHAAYLPAAANAILAAATLAAWRLWIVPAARSIYDAEEGQTQPGGELFLACVTGALVCVVLIGCITHATSGGAGEPERLGRTMTRKREARVEAKSKQIAADSADLRESAVRDALFAPFRQRPVALLAAAALLLSSLAGVVCIAARPRSNGLAEGEANLNDIPERGENLN